ncbi:dCTP deaminase [Egibacter rhizosphaerae]|uniref:dCTP deaminase, dUMP-forming n=1 Tax=Egibacter rhizosphaerae TaxID=1670831 RepID=A0A411YFV1_9ACTN|nr:dCTP deaminase [Egibacter rhizosphaerae]QBI20144.1 dCTP deaminase [Egibacter rhizosphaerae]
MILSDRDIRAQLDKGALVIDPLADHAIQPASVDVRIGDGFRVFANHRHPYIDTRAPQPDLTEIVEVAPGESFVLHPGEFVLGATYERVSLPGDLVARLEGKSSLGRLGLLVHATAGFIDSGFSGQLTLELSNVANLPIAIYPHMKIGQVALFQLSSPAEHPYGSAELGSKYQGQQGPTASRFYENFGEAGERG